MLWFENSTRGTRGIGELVRHRLGRVRDRGHRQGIAGDDGEVVGAHVGAAGVGVLVVEAGRIAERGVARAQALRLAVRIDREFLDAAARPFHDGERGVVGRFHEQGVEQVVELPDLTLEDRDLHCGLALGPGAHWHLAVQREPLERRQRGEQLHGAGGEMRLVDALPGQDLAAVGIHQDVGRGLLGGGCRRSRARRDDRRERAEHDRKREEPPPQAAEQRHAGPRVGEPAGRHGVACPVSPGLSDS